MSRKSYVRTLKYVSARNQHCPFMLFISNEIMIMSINFGGIRCSVPFITSSFVNLICCLRLVYGRSSASFSISHIKYWGLKTKGSNVLGKLSSSTGRFNPLLLGLPPTEDCVIRNGSVKEFPNKYHSQENRYCTRRAKAST